jgi:alkylation response protein AidB-like acyl-CoA dehydrogenase
MTFELSDEYRELRKEAHEFASKEIEPVALEHNREGRYPRNVIEKAAERGYVAETIPEEHGGPGRDMLESAIITEQLWRGDPAIGFAVNLVAFATNCYVLSNYAPEWMQTEWLEKFSSAEAINAIAVTEPTAGSNVAEIETQARKDGDEYIINGDKKFIGNATVADMYLLFVKTDLGKGTDGISAFLVPSDADGIKTNEISEKLGLNATDWGEIRFEDVRISKRYRIGKENKGFYYFMESLPRGRVQVAAGAVGAAQAALDKAIAYAEEREQFGQSISDFQAIQHKIAEMMTNIEAARALTYHAATLVDSNDNLARRFASMAKLFATEHAVDVTDEAIQIHGGAGYLSENHVERYYRDVRGSKIYEGTSEIQKNIIANSILSENV